ncbi:hypothetical protein JKP88DRAFT_243238 [Tribonema minus]|uniref:Uncharacterized protein n=1 Tax=Tribonema minus TaxID=303371 RepID=A0A835ZIU3_9STRA|nr:hypothetical protein JKP88DRAFT_243238 [Tribonema minus]
MALESINSNPRRIKISDDSLLKDLNGGTFMRLQLSECPVAVTEASLQRLTAKQCAALATIEMLSISRCGMEDAVIGTFLQEAECVSNGQLHALQVAGCAIGALTIQALVSRGACLRLLVLDMCEGISDAAVRALSRGCPNLDSVSCKQCPKLTPSGLWHWTGHARLTNLAGTLLIKQGDGAWSAPPPEKEGAPASLTAVSSTHVLEGALANSAAATLSIKRSRQTSISPMFAITAHYFARDRMRNGIDTLLCQAVHTYRGSGTLACQLVALDLDVAFADGDDAAGTCATFSVGQLAAVLPPHLRTLSIETKGGCHLAASSAAMCHLSQRCPDLEALVLLDSSRGFQGAEQGAGDGSSSDAPSESTDSDNQDVVSDLPLETSTVPEPRPTPPTSTSTPTLALQFAALRRLEVVCVATLPLLAVLEALEQSRGGGDTPSALEVLHLESAGGTRGGRGDAQQRSVHMPSLADLSLRNEGGLGQLNLTCPALQSLVLAGCSPLLAHCFTTNNRVCARICCICYHFHMHMKATSQLQSASGQFCGATVEMRSIYIRISGLHPLPHDTPAVALNCLKHTRQAFRNLISLSPNCLSAFPASVLHSNLTQVQLGDTPPSASLHTLRAPHTGLTETTIKNLLVACPSITSVDASGCGDMGDSALSQCVLSTAVSEVVLLGCRAVGGFALYRALSTAQLSTEAAALIELRLSHCRALTRFHLALLATALPALQRLSITSCHGIHVCSAAANGQCQGNAYGKRKKNTSSS